MLDDFAEYNGLPVLALPIVVLLVLNTSESVELSSVELRPFRSGSLAW